MSAQNSGKTPPGRPFKKGESGNPGGRPKGFHSIIDELAGGNAIEAYRIAWEVAKGTRKTQETRVTNDGAEVTLDVLPSIKEQLDAAKWLAEQRNGKAPQAVLLGQTEKRPFSITIVQKKAAK